MTATAHRSACRQLFLLVLFCAACFFSVSAVLVRAEVAPWPPVGVLAGGYPFGVAVQGNYAYVGAGPALTIVDISDPANPKRGTVVDRLR